jgi:hypothetical protein
MFYPTLFKDVDPLADYHALIYNFTHIPDDNIILSVSLVNRRMRHQRMAPAA